MPRMGGKSTQGGRGARRVHAGNGDAGDDRQLLRRPGGKGAELERNLIAAGFVKTGGDVYVSAFLRFIQMLAPGYHAVDRHAVRRWLDGEDNTVAAALVKVIQIPSAEVTRMIHEACQWGGRRKR